MPAGVEPEEPHQHREPGEARGAAGHRPGGRRGGRGAEQGNQGHRLYKVKVINQERAVLEAIELQRPSIYQSIN